MKNFSLNTLLRVKGCIFEKDTLALAQLQQKLARLLERKIEIEGILLELEEAVIEAPFLSQNIELMLKQLVSLDKEIQSQQLKITECKKSVTESLNRRKVVEKIRDNQYTLFQKERARSYEAYKDTFSKGL